TKWKHKPIKCLELKYEKIAMVWQIIPTYRQYRYQDSFLKRGMLSQAWLHSRIPALKNQE
ncbi:hypothetical protein ACQP3L_28125, partial [Escherichia coli]